ncbi:unnamed protein product [Staurois parvus]|uniref:Uncharacterized protein n=1 Tax=Staurois parvus TaxID=386267 RepID=A0ABN9DXV3_9NEOB|nr:unnamed protein product [Staurois parvus]
MVVIYFQRAKLEHTVRNFFAALYLANQMEEDAYHHLSILNFTRYSTFHDDVKKIFRRMNFRAWVRPEECQQVMKNLHHRVWERERKEHHGEAVKRQRRELRLLRPGTDYICERCKLRENSVEVPVLCRSMLCVLFGMSCISI